MSSDQVLLSRDAAGDWTRVGANQMLIPQQLLVLPTYRAKVSLTVGVTLDILGPARLELLGSSPPLRPASAFVYGRVVLMPLGKAGSQLRVAFGDRTGTITFVDSDSAAALDVRRLRCRGQTPRPARRGSPPPVRRHRRHLVGGERRRARAASRCSLRRRNA